MLVLARWSIVLGILAIPLGLFIVFSENIPLAGTFFAGLLCKGELQPEMLSCATTERQIPYEVLLGNFGGGLITGGFFLIVFGFVFVQIAKSFKLNRILTHGESAQATILEMNNTGFRVNDEPLLRFRLSVQPVHTQAYEAETARIISPSLLGSLSVGITIPVKYDPNKPEDVALDLDSYNALAMENTKVGENNEDSLTEKINELKKAYRLELVTEEEYEATRQRLIDEF